MDLPWFAADYYHMRGKSSNVKFVFPYDITRYNIEKFSHCLVRRAIAAMKLMRFLSRKGDVTYGVTEPNTPDLARIVAGAPVGDLTMTATQSPSISRASENSQIRP